MTLLSLFWLKKGLWQQNLVLSCQFFCIILWVIKIFLKTYLIVEIAIRGIDPVHFSRRWSLHLPWFVRFSFDINSTEKSRSWWSLWRTPKGELIPGNRRYYIDIEFFLRLLLKKKEMKRKNKTFQILSAYFNPLTPGSPVASWPPFSKSNHLAPNKKNLMHTPTYIQDQLMDQVVSGSKSWSPPETA